MPTLPSATANSKPFVGIPTTYRGVKFRSIIEARWAAFFDLRGGIMWEYEPIEFNGWIPDFVLDVAGHNELWLAEVKSVRTIEEAAYPGDLDKIEKALEATPDRAAMYKGVYLLGVNPNSCWIFYEQEWDDLKTREFTAYPEAWKIAGNLTQWQGRK